MSSEPRQIPPGMDPGVFSYLSDAFARLGAQLADHTRASRQNAELVKEALQRIERLEWHIFGPKGPPPLPEPAPETKPEVQP